MGGAGSGKGVGTLWGEGDGEVVSLGDRGHVLQILAAAQCRLICCTLLRYVACKMIMRKHVGTNVDRPRTSASHALSVLVSRASETLHTQRPFTRAAAWRWSGLSRRMTATSTRKGFVGPRMACTEWAMGSRMPCIFRLPSP